MRTLQARPQTTAGSALPMVLVFAVIGLLVLTSLLSWTTNESKLAQRRVQNQSSSGAAEAATENVIGRMIRDFQNGGKTTLDNNLDTDRSLIPDQVRSNFSFSSTLGDGRPIYVSKTADWSYTNLQSAWSGLSGQVASYRVLTQAQPLAPVTGAPTVVGQDIQFAYLPLFSFGIFYGPDLEIAPGSNWRITGRVHSNGSVFVQPNQATVTFSDYVTSSQQVLQQDKPEDPVVRSGGTVVFGKRFVNDVKTLTIPVGTNNSPAMLHALIEIPPTSESPTSALGQQRFYNNADLIILVGDTTNIVQSGAYNNFSVKVPWAQVSTFIGTNNWLYDKREGMSTLLTDVDLQGFQAKMGYLTGVLGRTVQTLYLADLRTNSWPRSAIRVSNGRTLPATGLTIATVNPLYVMGHFNVPTGTLGTTNTALTAPAALVADAVTVLSANWVDSYSYWPVSYRVAQNTTVNAAILSGIVPTGGGYYSGGAENAIRLLESWSGRTLTFNGSLAMLYYSTTADAPWGATSDVYTTPARNYNFDANFLNQTKLPPDAPYLRTTVRVKWSEAVPSS